MKIVDFNIQIPADQARLLRADAKKFNKALSTLCTMVIRDYTCLCTAERSIKLSRLPAKKMGRRLV